MKTHYIYLIQEREFIKTNENIFKIGRTEKENYQRFQQYPNGSILLFQMICRNCKSVECEILQQFKSQFTQKQEIGNEYFQGDYKLMIDIIYSVIKNNNNDVNSIIDENDTICQKIKNVFFDYKNDESFGGDNKYIIIKHVNNLYKIFYLYAIVKEDYNNWDDEKKDIYNYGINNIDNVDLKQLCYNDFIGCYEINEYVADKLKYFYKIMSERTILIDTVININSLKIINKIAKSKIHLIVENYSEFKNILLLNNKSLTNSHGMTDTDEKIRKMFQCNALLNNDLYCTIVEDDYITYKKLKNFEQIRIDVGIRQYVIETLYKINNKFYAFIYLRKYLPYTIRWMQNKTYYILNRDYEYIGLNTKQADYDHGEYIYNDGSKPWESEENFKNMCKKYYEIIEKNDLKDCLNANSHVSVIKNLINLIV